MLVNNSASMMMGFESLKTLYSMDPNFKEVFESLYQGKRVDKFQLVDGFFSKDAWVCVPRSSR